MELVMTRTIRTNRSTISDLTVDGKFECFVLEDKDRGLQQGMTLSELMALKIKTKTAIPSGRYEIVVSFSDRFQKMLPLLLDVPAYAGIMRILKDVFYQESPNQLTWLPAVKLLSLHYLIK